MQPSVVSKPGVISKLLRQFIPIKLLKRVEIFRASDRHSVETVPLSTYVAKYQYVLKYNG